MAWGDVQGGSPTTVNNAQPNGISFTFGSNVTINNRVEVKVECNENNGGTGGQITVTSTGTATIGTWIRLTEAHLNISGFDCMAESWTAVVLATGTLTVTAKADNTAVQWQLSMCCRERSGLSTANDATCVDVSAISVWGASPLQAVSPATNAANELASIGYYDTGLSKTITAGGSAVMRSFSGTSTISESALEDIDSGASGSSITGTWTGGQTAQTTADIVIFKLAVVSGTTANGTLKSVTGTALTTLALTATSAIGDLRVFLSKVVSGTITVSSLSGGDCPASGSGTSGRWTRIAGPNIDTNATVNSHELWVGVCNAVGTTTITITWSGSVTGLGTDLECQTFSFGNASTLWSKDGTQSGFNNNASSATITYPSLTAQNGMELCVGHSRNPTGGAYGTPTGGGFTWVTQTDANGNTFIYSLSTGPGVVAPTQTSTATLSYAIGALILVSAPPSFMKKRPSGLRQGVNRSATY